ncbi:HAD family hydrolase [Miniphocaeibacter halophilus]|uniref:HAD family hydrolase n=1 Tax=Miniphocaeibacter halophilus TaxID=2931922 RepID=A0AC61MS99_9FIRM|nr:HAD family hydrolase [Miniphocaeibacter halophilus]QQK07485.1 HAD family hydrolase [Miniphocaeibacter halophilus]
MYKIVCLDLDGTLLNDDKQISQFNLQVLEALHYKGIEIAIATGRGLSKTADLIKNFNFPHIIIANNGAIAKYSNFNNILFYNPIDYKSYEKILDISSTRNMYPYLHIFDSQKERSLIIPNEVEKEKHIGSVSRLDEIIHRKEAGVEELENILSVVYIDEVEKVHKLNEDILKLRLDLSTHMLSSFSKGNIMVEYLNPLAQKSIGISNYLKFKKISWKEVISFGDDNNDIEMIKASGLGICMKNGSDLLKLNSRYISRYTNNEDGVGRELVEIFGGIL